MKERFQGDGHLQLLSALRRQEFAGNKLEIAEALAAVGELIDIAIGQDLIVQNETDDDIYLLIAGTVAVMVNGAQVATRSAGQHVGEMAPIEASLPRSATVRALQHTVALKLSGPAFMKIAAAHPDVWLPIAKELSRRLSERNKTIYLPNASPKLFIMSSSEAKDVAYALRAGLGKDVSCTVWDQGVFFAGGYVLEALDKQVNDSDFAVAIAEPDDITSSRGKRAKTVRDNVLFELGLFMGKLTRFRSVLLHPKVKDLKLPSDLQGLTLISYEAGNKTTFSTRIQPACDSVRELVKRLGVRTFSFENNR
jgi:CRP/FNR family cyclic AMP-dependent transcriptional regulator